MVLASVIGERMRVSLVSPEFPPDSPAGGIGTNTWTLAHALARRGVAVQVVTYGRPGREDEDGVEVVRVPPLEARTGRGRRLRASHDLAAEARRFRPDVVQAAEWGAAGWWISRFHTTPVVTRLATPSFLTRRTNENAALKGDARSDWLERDQTRRSALVYGPTNAIVEEVARAWGLDRSEMRVVPNSIDLSGVRVAADSAPPIELPARFIVFVGRLERRKGAHVLLDALPAVLESDPHLNVLLIGGDTGGDSGARALDIDRRVSALGARVRTLGELPRDQALAIVARAELSVVPSLWESFGYVAIEAMALGVPVVASRAGGLAEIVEDGASGWLVPPGDPSALGAVISARLADKEALAVAGKTARARAEDFGTDRVLDRVIELFKIALSR